MPVGPEDAVGLDVQVHGVDAHVGVTLERLLVHPVGHTGVQAANLVVISDVEHLPVDIQTWQRDRGAATDYSQCLRSVRSELVYTSHFCPFCTLFFYILCILFFYLLFYCCCFLLLLLLFSESYRTHVVSHLQRQCLLHTYAYYEGLISGLRKFYV